MKLCRSHWRLPLTRILIGLNLLAVAHCGRKARPDRTPALSTINPQALAPTRGESTNPLEWVDATEEEIYNTVDAIHGHPSYVPLDDPASIRIQSWMDGLDARLREQYPERFFDKDGNSLVPHPHARLMIREGGNAFNSSATVCLSVPVRFAGIDAKASNSDGQNLIMIDSKGKIGIYPRDRISCLDRMHQVQSVDLLIRHLEETLQLKGCQVSKLDDTLVIGKDCHLPTGTAVAGAKGIVLQLTSNWITFQTSLFTLFPSEDQLVNTIFHELAHFYRAHGSLNKKDYQYFYRISAQNHSRPNPETDSSLDTLGKKLLALPSYRTQPIPGQVWHSEMFSYAPLAWQSLLQPACRDPSSPCHAGCQPFFALMQDPEVKKSFGRFPQENLLGSKRELYLHWEASLSQCLKSVMVYEHPSLTPELIRKVYWNSSMKDGDLTEATLFEVAQAMNTVFFERDKQQDRLLEQALKERLGYYTTEEEADNMALFWLGQMGLENQSALDHWITYGTFRKNREQNSTYNFAPESCFELYDADPRWTRNGLSIEVPVGSFGEPHHSTCFRLWNLDQRRKHMVTQPGKRHPQLNENAEANFAQLRDRITKLFPTSPSLPEGERSLLETQDADAAFSSAKLNHIYP